MGTSSLPGEVQSDEQAFHQILVRLEGEDGMMLRLIRESKKTCSFPDTTPSWPLARMLFPIAASVGDFIHRNDESATKNLQALLENECEDVRAGYRGKASFLALSFRHSLTHMDELRTLVTRGVRS